MATSDLTAAIVRWEGAPIGRGPATPCEQYEDMDEKCALVDDLMAGTLRMRRRGTLWLPREKGEKEQYYQARLRRSFLYPMLADTVDKLSSKPFIRPPAASEDDLPEKLREIVEDADGNGMNLADIAQQALFRVAAFGRAFIMVDHTAVPDGATKADEDAIKARPVLIPVHPRAVTSWGVEAGENGAPRLSFVRFLEGEWEQDSRDGFKQRRKWTVWEYRRGGTYRQWEYKNYKWTDGASGTLTMVGGRQLDDVPLIAAFAKRDEFMVCSPPLFPLAEVNLAHWQSSSDQRNILRVARVPMLHMTGVARADLNKPEEISPNRVMKSVEPTARVGWVEHSGAAIAAGERDLATLVSQGETLGMQPLQASSATSTASGKVIDEARNESPLQRWIGQVDALITGSVRLAGEWAGTPVPDDWAYKLFRDFSVVSGDDGRMDTVMQLRLNGDITQRTTLSEAVRRGVLREDTDIDDEIEETGMESGASLKPDPSAPGLPGAPNNKGVGDGGDGGDGGVGDDGSGTE